MRARELYSAAEDTFLLARGVEGIIECPGLVAEIGCGGGLVTEVMAELGCEVVSTDVSAEAARETWLRAKRRGLDARVHVICCDRLEAVRAGEVFDLVAFNPPYLPDEEGDLSYSGGPTGVEVPLAFAGSAYERLKRGRLMVFVLSSLSEWRRALRALASKGCAPSVLSTAHVGLFEDLMLVACVKTA